ncbi:MAG TPA: hypothetical protein VNO54_28035 [Streptosporangiaceae bacterium]|nr:hypothetical protein [Streptosporangiaceae bacterium]
MATYTVVGRNVEGSTVVSVNFGGVDQDGHYLDDLDVVNVVRSLLAGTAGVSSVVAKRYEQVITVV